MSIEAVDFEYVRKIVYEHSAIVLEPGKEYLVEVRLIPLLREESVSSISELVSRLRATSYSGTHRKVIEAMTTNETSFFRDKDAYAVLKDLVFPKLIEKRGNVRSLNIWCGACSSGQEPYSVAMLMRENFPVLSGWSVRLVATDISREMLKRSQEGVYSQFEVNRGLPAPLMVKYFEQTGTLWRIKEEVRRMIEYQEVNLASTWPPLPVMDVIMIRNVMIYFNTETKKTILSKVRKVLKPDGFLLLGGAETTMNLDDAFKRVRFGNAGCYQLQT